MSYYLEVSKHKIFQTGEDLGLCVDKKKKQEAECQCTA
jgi:hypothetical protein